MGKIDAFIERVRTLDLCDGPEVVGDARTPHRVRTYAGADVRERLANVYDAQPASNICESSLPASVALFSMTEASRRQLRHYRDVLVIDFDPPLLLTVILVGRPTG